MSLALAIAHQFTNFQEFVKVFQIINVQEFIEALQIIIIWQFIDIQVFINV